MTEQEFAEYMALTHELPGVEFKEPRPRSDKLFFAKVARAVLGMTNRRDGGLVIIGVEEDSQGVLTPVGLTGADLATLQKYDDIASALSAYADPSVSFELEVQEYEKKKYVVLQVQEFEDIPVLCKKDYPQVLRAGACYVRSRRRPETSEIPSQADMRDLLELATEKRLRRFVAQTQAAGLGLSGARPPTDQDLFDTQGGDFEESTLLKKILSRGYWQIIIRPGKFEKSRISVISTLYPLLQKTSVQLRGWDFPHVDRQAQPRIDLDWIGQESEWDQYLEVWRFYQSGQFVDFSGMQYDWRDQSRWRSAEQNWRPGALLEIGHTVYRFTEIFEFASRLALTEAGDEQMHIEITVSGLQGRVLWVDLPNRAPLWPEHSSWIEKFPYEVDLQRADLIAAPRELALKPVHELFQRFGWNPTIELLRGIQAELRKS